LDTIQTNVLQLRVPKIFAIARDGVEAVIEGTIGLSVMENLRNAGCQDILALCGGNCSCGTCHVYVDPKWLARLSPVGDGERDLLEPLSHRRETSRLSCQIRFDGELDEMRLEIAPEE